MVVSIAQATATEAVQLPLLERWSKFNKSIQEQSFSIPEWRNVQESILADEKLSNQIGHEIGSYLFTAKQLTLDSIGGAFVNEAIVTLLGDEKQPVESEQVRFDKIYEPLDAYLAADTLNYDVFVPLIGLACDNKLIQLDDATSIERMESSDIARFRIGLALSNAGFYGQIDEDNLPDFYRFRLHVRRDLPKLIGPGHFSQEKALEFYGDVEQRTRDALRSIAAVTFSRVLPWPAQVNERGFLQVDTRGITLSQPQTVLNLVSPGATIPASQEPWLIKMWDHLRHAQFSTHETNRAIGLALDRLAMLGANISRLREQLVDAVIACEAFYTLGQASQQELRYRVATNAAFYSSKLEIGLAPRAVFQLVYEAYNVRSKIVHGGDLRAKHVTYESAPAGYPTTLDERLNYFVCYVAELVRRGIVISMFDAQPGAAIAIDWEEIVFSQ